MAHRTIHVRYEDRLEALPLKRLPRSLQKKIVLEVPQGDERSCCWLWTGAVQPTRRRLHTNKAGPDYEGDGAAFAFVNDREIPKVHSPELRRAVPAYRQVFADTYQMSFRDVPRLRRCCNDRCVSPYHCMPVEVPESRRRSAAPESPPPAPATPEKPARPPLALVDEILGKLRAKDIPHFIGMDDAAIEAGIDPLLLTSDIWKQYYLECEARENELDADDEDD